MITILLLTLATLFSILYWKKIYRYDVALKPINGPKQIPILRNLHQFGGGNPEELINNFSKLQEEYGNFYKFFLGAGNCFVVIIDPDLVEVILNSQDQIKKNITYTLLEPWLGDGLLTSTGERWHKHRKIITPTFHFQILENFVESFNTNEEIMIQKLKALQDGEVVNIYNFVNLCALDIICEAAMGVSVHAQQNSESEYVTAIKDVSEAIMERLFKPWLYNNFVYQWTELYKRQNRDLKILHAMTKQVIAERKQELKQNKSEFKNVEDDTGHKKRKAFLDLLLDSAQVADLTDEDIQAEVDTFMFEGHDTTSSAISFTIWLLSKHQDIQENAVQELNEIFEGSDRHSCFRDLQKMKYLEQVIKESMRLYPSVPFMAREIVSNFHLGEYVIPKGTSLIIDQYHLHRNEKFFPNPEKFDPERFSNDNVRGRHPFCYIPFSAGPRNCIGQKFAMMEMKSMISTLLRNFELLPVDEPVKLRADLILKSSNGMVVKMRTRIKK